MLLKKSKQYKFLEMLLGIATIDITNDKPISTCKRRVETLSLMQDQEISTWIKKKECSKLSFWVI